MRVKDFASHGVSKVNQLVGVVLGEALVAFVVQFFELVYHALNHLVLVVLDLEGLVKFVQCFLGP